MTLVYDIGMFDASDTEYFLAEGARVVAVEANPGLVERARHALPDELAAGRLVIVNAAVTEPGLEEVDLRLCVDDLGSSSLFEEVIWGTPGDTITVPAVTIDSLIESFGIPDHMKIDIEGADRHCLLPLTALTRPRYLSFEAGEDMEELLDHARSIGFSRFKLINQRNFREISRDRLVRDRVARRLVGVLGYSEPEFIRRSGRFYKARHSSGPAPWASDGPWRSADTLLRQWSTLTRGGRRHGAWYDVHAM
jgi:FkbM family methyltransferase